MRPDPSLLLLPPPPVSPHPLASPSGTEQGGAQARLRPRASTECRCTRTGLQLPGLELRLEGSGPWAAPGFAGGGEIGKRHPQGCCGQPGLSTQSLRPCHPRLQATFPGAILFLSSLPSPALLKGHSWHSTQPQGGCMVRPFKMAVLLLFVHPLLDQSVPPAPYSCEHVCPLPQLATDLIPALPANLLKGNICPRDGR